MKDEDKFFVNFTNHPTKKKKKNNVEKQLETSPFLSLAAWQSGLVFKSLLEPFRRITLSLMAAVTLPKSTLTALYFLLSHLCCYSHYTSLKGYRHRK